MDRNWKEENQSIPVCKCHPKYRETKDSTNRVLELIGRFREIAEYKINI